MSGFKLFFMCFYILYTLSGLEEWTLFLKSRMVITAGWCVNLS